MNFQQNAFQNNYPSPGGVAQLVERVLYHSTRRAVPERSWVQSLLPTTEVEPGFSTFGGMLVPVAAADQPGVQDWYIPLPSKTIAFPLSEAPVQLPWSWKCGKTWHCQRPNLRCWYVQTAPNFHRSVQVSTPPSDLVTATHAAVDLTCPARSVYRAPGGPPIEHSLFAIRACTCPTNRYQSRQDHSRVTTREPPGTVHATSTTYILLHRASCQDANLHRNSIR
jgi:hypothetical protein